MNHKQELERLIVKFRSMPDAYLLEEVVIAMEQRGVTGEVVGGGYSVSDVHEWGRQEGCRKVYERLGDLHKLRIYRAVEKDKLDRVLASEMLKPYYKREVGERVATVNIYLPEQKVIGGGGGD